MMKLPGGPDIRRCPNPGKSDSARGLALACCLSLLSACSENAPDDMTLPAEAADSVAACDLRTLFGTCHSYSLQEHDEGFAANIEASCRSNRRGDLRGEYRAGAGCPTEKRVARCEGIVEDAYERFEYDKHYYSGTAELYSWDPDNVRVTCETVSGRFFPE